MRPDDRCGSIHVTAAILAWPVLPKGGHSSEPHEYTPFCKEISVPVGQPTKTIFMLGALLWSGAGLASPFLLPSQDTPNFYNAKMCRDRQVLSALKTAATTILKTKVIVAGGDGPEWSGYQPGDIHLEAVF
jgi:hypothetical protein